MTARVDPCWCYAGVTRAYFKSYVKEELLNNPLVNATPKEKPLVIPSINVLNDLKFFSFLSLCVAPPSNPCFTIFNWEMINYTAKNEQPILAR